MRSLIISILSLGTSLAAAGQGPPSTDIFLARLSIQGNRIEVGTPVNITNQPGYDNQPFFAPDGRGLLFASVRGDRQTDIYRYDLASKAITRVTSTPESEYSPVVMPGGNRFSVIRVEKDSAQRLWSFKLDGSEPAVIFPTVKPVGYHSWIGPDAAVLFLLGRGPEPNALVWAERSGRVDTLARDIGRTLAPLASGSGFSFVQRMPDSTWQLRTGGASRPTGFADLTSLVTLPRGAEFVAWISAGRVLTTSGSKILVWRRGADTWAEVADLASAGLTRLSRLAVSPDGKWLAIVDEPRR